MAKEYIEREAALEEANGFPFTMSMCLSEQECVGMQRAQAIIAKRIIALPAADVVEVVRCKDCEHYHAAKDCFGWCVNIESPVWDRGVENDWFCADGERREAQHDS